MANEILVTIEGFLSFIELNDRGVTKDNFKGLDIDDFIRQFGLHERRLATVNLKNMLRLYTFLIQDREFDKYRATEVFSIYSSYAEFESFKNIFFGKIGAEAQHIGTFGNFMERYSAILNDERIGIIIGQTRYMDAFDFHTDPNGFLSVRIGPSASEHLLSQFSYSKNKKYFMLLPGIGRIELVRAFSEIDN